MWYVWISGYTWPGQYALKMHEMCRYLEITRMWFYFISSFCFAILFHHFTLSIHLVISSCRTQHAQYMQYTLRLRCTHYIALDRLFCDCKSSGYRHLLSAMVSLFRDFLSHLWHSGIDYLSLLSHFRGSAASWFEAFRNKALLSVFVCVVTSATPTPAIKQPAPFLCGYQSSTHLVINTGRKKIACHLFAGNLKNWLKIPFFLACIFCLGHSQSDCRNIHFRLNPFAPGVGISQLLRCVARAGSWDIPTFLWT